MITQQTEVDSVHRNEKKLNLTKVCEVKHQQGKCEGRSSYRPIRQCHEGEHMVLVGGVRENDNCMRKMYAGA